jgi:hypothetical protein
MQEQRSRCTHIELTYIAAPLAGLLHQVPAAQAALDNLRKLVENHAHR